MKFQLDLFSDKNKGPKNCKNMMEGNNILLINSIIYNCCYFKLHSPLEAQNFETTISRLSDHQSPLIQLKHINKHHSCLRKGLIDLRRSLSRFSPVPAVWLSPSSFYATPLRLRNLHKRVSESSFFTITKRKNHPSLT